MAQQQIDSGALCGYLAYVDGIAVGWCNANDRASFPSEPYCDVSFHAPTPKREVAVVCFEVAPASRGKGVATALLSRVLSDAKVNGYLAVVSFPVMCNERYEWDCTGPIRLYEKAGFRKISTQGESVMMRKELA